MPMLRCTTHISGWQAGGGGADSHSYPEWQYLRFVLRFMSAHYRAIHRHLLQDVYDWAGKIRTGA